MLDLLVTQASAGFLHPQWMNSLQTLNACGEWYTLAWIQHPCFVSSPICGIWKILLNSVGWYQTCPAWIWGSFDMFHECCFCWWYALKWKSPLIKTFWAYQLQLCSCIQPVYLFRTASSSELTSSGIELCFWNTGVTSGRAFHVSNADILPFPTNDDVVSEPLKAWKNNKPSDLSSARAFAMAVS